MVGGCTPVRRPVNAPWHGWLRTLVLLHCWLPLPVWAWGAEGHRTTAYIATPLLSPVARTELLALMGTIDLPAWSTWMDEHRDALRRTAPGSEKWHYDNRPVCAAATPLADYCPADDCASEQVRRLQDVLADPEAPVEARQQAVRLLVHLVGDLHQPLHAGDHGDRGGNAIRITLIGPLFPTNLHAIWDNDLVNMTLWHDTASPTRADSLVRANARELARRYAPSLPAWQRGTVRDWMAESYALARRVVYAPLPGFRCELPATETGTAPLTLPDDYLAQARAIIPGQLARAGARIASVLNTALETAAHRRAAPIATRTSRLPERRFL